MNKIGFVDFVKASVNQIKWIYILLVTALLFAVSTNFQITGEDEFTVLSSQLTHGKFYIPEVVGDAVWFNGHYYWHLGPFPALLLTPLTAISEFFVSQPFPQGVANVVMVVMILYLVYLNSVKYGFKPAESLWISFATVFGSVFFLSVLLPWSWHFSQTVTFLFGLLAFYEYKTKNRDFLIGICHGFMFMTRFTAGYGILFYLAIRLFGSDMLKEKLRSVILMTFPIFLSGILLLGYNYVRFGNIWDNGYTTSNNWVTNSEMFRYEMFHYGLFDINNIPTNFYYYFISMPTPVLEKVEGFSREIFKTPTTTIFHMVPPYVKVAPPGVSFFVVSPIFLLMFRNKLKSKESRVALFTSLFILSFLLTYYWTGWTQIGPRYMIDLLPFLLIIFLESFKEKKFTSFHKVIISLSVFFNLFLFFQLFSAN